MKKIVLSVIVAIAGAVACSLAHAERQVAPDEVRADAKDVYIYGYPLLDEWRIMFGFAVDKAGS
jgi:hypothetical protein